MATSNNIGESNLMKISLLIGSFCLFAGSLCRAADPAPPVTPDAAPEAVQLLNFIHQISGQHTLTGQHNLPADNDKETVAASKAWGKIPAIFGKDWGFAKQGDKDSAFVRQDVVDEIKEHYKNGSLIVLCWHEVPPTADEPVAFRPRRGGGGSTNTSANLHTVQGHLTEAQYKDLLTPGTALHRHWCDQVDAIVPYLKQLQDAHVPVLWRPFHEMNGQWFWWGGRAKKFSTPAADKMKGGERMGMVSTGDYSTAALYKMMFDRLVNHHKLKNLIWVWNVDRPEGTTIPFNECWPGPEYVDVVSFDCYRVFKQSYYDDILKLANGKPVALAEVGGNLSLDALKAQPKWAWWMLWAGMGLNGDAAGRLTDVVNDPHSWSLSDPDYRKAIAPIRTASGLPAEPPAPTAP
jgi:mannan endo-1,4-beta-mannosidase